MLAKRTKKITFFKIHPCIGLLVQNVFFCVFFMYWFGVQFCFMRQLHVQQLCNIVAILRLFFFFCDSCLVCRIQHIICSELHLVCRMQLFVFSLSYLVCRIQFAEFGLSYLVCCFQLVVSSVSYLLFLWLYQFLLLLFKQKSLPF